MPYSVHSRFDDLPAPHQGLFALAGRQGFHCTPGWFRALAATTLDDGESLRLLAASDEAGRPLAVLPLVARARRAGPLTVRTLSAFVRPYTCAFAPVADPAAPEAAAAALARALRAERRHWDVLDLSALPEEAPLAAAMPAALAAAGLPIQRYRHFVNRYAETRGLSAANYLAARPGALRSTLRRQQAKVRRDVDAQFEIVTGGDGVGPALDAYQAVYARSWKQPEPHPGFIPALVRACAEAGALRLGTVHVGEVPAAAQIWIVWEGRATIFKLAHDEAFKQHSLGSLLTLRMMEHVLALDRVAEVDFGRGDDGYKRNWLPLCRDRFGVQAFNARTAAGALMAARHIGGGAARRALAPLRRRGDPAAGQEVR